MAELSDSRWHQRFGGSGNKRLVPLVDNNDQKVDGNVVGPVKQEKTGQRGGTKGNDINSMPKERYSSDRTLSARRRFEESTPRIK